MRFKKILSEMEVTPHDIQTIYIASALLSPPSLLTPLLQKYICQKILLNVSGVSKQWALEVWEIDKNRADGKDGQTVLLRLLRLLEQHLRC